MFELVDAFDVFECMDPMELTWGMDVYGWCFGGPSWKSVVRGPVSYGMSIPCMTAPLCFHECAAIIAGVFVGWMFAIVHGSGGLHHSAFSR